MKTETVSPEIYIDPVCMMKLGLGNKNLMFTHKMRTYYFCAESCRKAFDENPHATRGYRIPDGNPLCQHVVSVDCTPTDLS